MTSRYSLARRLLRDAERHDLPDSARAALVLAAHAVALSVLRDPSTPFRRIPPLVASCQAATDSLERPRAVH